MKNSHIRHFVLSLACGLSLSGQSALAYSWPTPFENTSSQMQRADKLMATGQYAQALPVYLEIHSNSSGDRYQAGLALSNAGECARRLKRYGEAKQYFSKSFMFLNAGAHVGDRSVNVMLVRHALCYLAEGDYAQAEALLKKCLDNSLGIWTFNYGDLISAANYTQMLVQVANLRNGGGERWVVYTTQELMKLSQRPDNTGLIARRGLEQLGTQRSLSGATMPVRPIQPHRQDPYFQSSGAPWRARYGTNGTEWQFQNFRGYR